MAPDPVSRGATPTDVQARMVASGCRPSAVASSSETSASAAAASFDPQALPAVMENPSISGCSGGSAATFASDVVALGCSSAVNSTTEPSRRVTLIGKISSAKRPVAVASTARWWERTAQASICSLLIP